MILKDLKKHTVIKTIYRKNRNYSLKLLKCLAVWLRFEDLIFCKLKGWSAKARSEGAKVLIKIREYSVQLNNTIRS